MQGVRGRVEAREQWVARSGVARGGGGGGEKRVYFVAFLAVPRQWSVNVATGSQTTSCLMSQYNDGPRNSTKSKWMLPGGSPTREMITSNITRDDESYAESIPVSRTVPPFHSWQILNRVFLSSWNDHDHYFPRSFVLRSLVEGIC